VGDNEPRGIINKNDRVSPKTLDQLKRDLSTPSSGKKNRNGAQLSPLSDDDQLFPNTEDPDNLRITPGLDLSSDDPMND